MCLYSCRPKRRIGAASAVCVFFFVSAMAFSAVGLNNNLRRLFDLTAMLMLLICFMVAKRFIITAYSYAVYSGESVDLIIYEHTLADKEPTVVCRIALSSVTEVSEIHGKRKRKKTDKTVGYISYAASMLERDYILLTYSEYDEIGVIKLSFDKDLLSVIEKYK